MPTVKRVLRGLHILEYLSTTGDLKSFPFYVPIFSATSESKDSEAVVIGISLKLA